MTKFAHSTIHSPERLKRFEGHMDPTPLIAGFAIGLIVLAALLAPANLVPW